MPNHTTNTVKDNAKAIARLEAELGALQKAGDIPTHIRLKLAEQGDAITRLEAEVKELEASENINFAAKYRTLEAISASMRKVLEDNAFSNHHGKRSFCHCCGGWERTGHNSDCDILQALSGDEGRELLVWAKKCASIVQNIDGYPNPPAWLMKGKNGL